MRIIVRGRLFECRSWRHLWDNVEVLHKRRLSLFERGVWEVDETIDYLLSGDWIETLKEEKPE